MSASPAQIAAGFTAAKAQIDKLVQRMVPPWAFSMVQITDNEIHDVSDSVVEAVVKLGETDG